jgi:transcriptional regulator with XRE-family HTH domain
MADHMPHYTRRYRLRAGLTQKEMAHLLGSRSPATVCQYEARTREPDLRTALAYQVVFGLPVDKLFPGIHREVEQAVIRRAQHLAQRLSSTRSGASLTHKRQALSAISADWRSLDESAGPNSNHDQP